MYSHRKEVSPFDYLHSSCKEEPSALLMSKPDFQRLEVFEVAFLANWH